MLIKIETMEKIFKVADIRELDQKCMRGEISYSRKVELINEIANKTRDLDFKQLRDAYFKEHVSHKTTDGIPRICTHPHNLFEWFKAELKEYGC